MPVEFMSFMEPFMPFARLVIDLLLLRRGPQDMPASTSALYGAAAAYCILLFFQIRIIAPTGSALFQALVSVVALGSYAFVLLRMRGYANRAPQTMTALFTAGGVFSVLNLGPTAAMAPFILALGQAGPITSIPQPSPIAALAGVAIAFWSLAVFAHIYRHALQVRFWQGLAAAFGFEVVLLIVFSLIGRL